MECDYASINADLGKDCDDRTMPRFCHALGCTAVFCTSHRNEHLRTSPGCVGSDDFTPKKAKKLATTAQKGGVELKEDEVNEKKQRLKLTAQKGGVELKEDAFEVNEKKQRLKLTAQKGGVELKEDEVNEKKQRLKLTAQKGGVELKEDAFEINEKNERLKLARKFANDASRPFTHTTLADAKEALNDKRCAVILQCLHRIVRHDDGFNKFLKHGQTVTARYLPALNFVIRSFGGIPKNAEDYHTIIAQRIKFVEETMPCGSLDAHRLSSNGSR